MAQEILLGEAVIGVVNTVEDNRDREYTCNNKLTDQTVQSKIKSQQVGSHATNSLSPLAVSMGPRQKYGSSGGFLGYPECYSEKLPSTSIFCTSQTSPAYGCTHSGISEQQRRLLKSNVYITAHIYTL